MMFGAKGKPREEVGGGRDEEGKDLIKPLPWEPLGALGLAPGGRTGSLARVAQPVRSWGRVGPKW